MMNRGVVATSKGVVVEGRLVVLAEENDGLIYIGDEFLDDLLRERFGPGTTGNESDSPSGAPVEVDRVRMVIEVVRDEDDKTVDGPEAKAN